MPRCNVFRHRFCGTRNFEESECAAFSRWVKRLWTGKPMLAWLYRECEENKHWNRFLDGKNKAYFAADKKKSLVFDKNRMESMRLSSIWRRLSFKRDSGTAAAPQQGQILEAKI